MTTVFRRALAACAVALLSSCFGSRELQDRLDDVTAEKERLATELAAVRLELAERSSVEAASWPGEVVLERAAGSDGMAPFSRSCPRGEALIGFFTRAGGAVESLLPICQPLIQPPGLPDGTKLARDLPLVGLPRRGDPHGQAQICPPGEQIVGIAGREGHILDALAPVCRARPDGKPHTLPAAGGTGGSPFERGCPARWLAVGISGRSSDLITSLSLHCAPAGDQ
jgi:hypothetical protein